MKVLKTYSIIAISILVAIFISVLGMNKANAQDLILNGIDTTMYGVHTFNNIKLLNGAVIHVAPYEQQTQKGKITLRANNITISGGSWINADGCGTIGLGTPANGMDYWWGGAGGGYGGKGGYGGAGTQGGNTYEAKYGNYVSMGSNGSNCYSNWGIGGNGGGSINLFCDVLIIEGVVSANGLQGTYTTSGGGGGGSGGGVLINCNSFTLRNTGSITADGGNGGGGVRSGGGGGGGRIKVIYGIKSVGGKITTNAGLSINVPTAGHGENGTIWYNNYPKSPNLISPIDNMVTNNLPFFKLISDDRDISDKLFYKIEVSNDFFKTIYQFYDQTTDSSGWSKEFYNAGDTAKYKPLIPLHPGTYQWRAYAFDEYVWSDGWKIDNPVPSVVGEFDVQSTGVTEIPHQPIEYRLEQNYPNPFNPNTTIEFSISSSTHVVLKIYDLLGKEVATLVDDELPMGQHQVNWNAQNFASGVYIYKFQGGEFVQMKKMILIQ